MCAVRKEIDMKNNTFYVVNPVEFAMHVLVHCRKMNTLFGAGDNDFHLSSLSVKVEIIKLLY